MSDRLNKLTNYTEGFFKEKIIFWIQQAPVDRAFPVAVKLVKMTILVGLDEANIMKVDFVLRV